MKCGPHLSSPFFKRCSYEVNENCNIIYFLLLRVAIANNDHTTYCQIKSHKKVVTDSKPFTKGQFRQMSL